MRGDVGENMGVGVFSRPPLLWTRLSPSELLSMLRMEPEGLSWPGLEIGEKVGSAWVAASGTGFLVGTCSGLGSRLGTCSGLGIGSGSCRGV